MKRLSPLIEAAAALSFLGWLSPVAHAAPLGPLFFTPEQRVAIVRARAEEAQTATATSAAANQAPARAAAQSLSVDGLITRSAGPPSVWVNGNLVEPGANGQPPASVAVEGRTVRVNGSARLKVGQTWGPGPTANIVDLVEKNSITAGGLPAKPSVDPASALRLKRSSPPPPGWR